MELVTKFKEKKEYKEKTDSSTDLAEEKVKQELDSLDFSSF